MEDSIWNLRDWDADRGCAQCRAIRTAQSGRNTQCTYRTMTAITVLDLEHGAASGISEVSRNT